MTLRIEVFGPLRAFRDEASEPLKLEGPTARALLAYLILHPGSHRRKALAPNLGEPPKRLTRSLYELRALREAGVLTVTRDSLELRRNLVALNYDVFRETARNKQATVEQRAAAFAIASAGELLEGLERSDGGSWPWLEEARTQAHQQLMSLCAANAEALARVDPAAAIEWAERLVELEPDDALAVVSLMRRHLAVGSSDQAIRVARNHLALRAELEIGPPAGAFDVLLKQLTSGELTARANAIRASIPATATVDLVGAEDLLGQLTRKTAHAGDSRRVLIVEGVAGIGKTRLIAEVEARWIADEADNGPASLYGRFAEERGEYSAFAQAIRGYIGAWTATGAPFDQLGPRAGHLCRLLPDLPELVPGIEVPPSIDPGADRVALFDAVATLLERIAAEGPALVLLDDVHGADRSSLELLLHCVGRTAASPLTFLCTTRPQRDPHVSEALARLEQDHPRATSRDVVQGLTVDETEVLVERLLERAPSASEVRTVQDVTAGRPFDIEQAVRGLEAGRVDIGLSAAGTDPGLDEQTTRLLQIAALLGERFEISTLAHVGECAPDTVEAMLHEAQERAVVVAERDGLYRFAHALHRNRLVEASGITPERQAALSERAAVHLTARADVSSSLLARLWRQAGDLSSSVRWLRQAAADAEQALAYEKAARLLEQAGEMLEEIDADADERCDVHLALGAVLWSAGHFRDSGAAFERASRHAHDPDRRARRRSGRPGGSDFRG